MLLFSPIITKLKTLMQHGLQQSPNGSKGATMEEAKTGARARIHYTAKLHSGQVVGSSRGGQPLSFTIGKGKVFKALELGIRGMQVGQSRTIEIPPEQGYGERKDDLVMVLKKSEFAENIPFEVGRTIQYRSETQEVINFIIIDVGDDTVTVDANHPFAGQTVIYDVHLVALN